MTQVFLTNASSSPYSKPGDFPTPVDAPQVLLLHCNGTDGSTTFTDDSPSGHTVSVNGSAQIDTAQSKFSGGSGLFDGTGDYLQLDSPTDFAFGWDSFTIDFWFRLASIGRFHQLYDSSDSAADSTTPIIGVNDTNKLFLSFGDAAGALNCNTTLAADTWYHCAVVRTDYQTFRIFLDGTEDRATITSTVNCTCKTNRPVIGADGTALTAVTGLNGWIDELRVTRSAIWTSNFTPPSAAYSTAAEVSKVELVGCGGNGASGTTGTSHDGGSGGGGGAYTRRTNLTLASTTPFRIPAGGGGVTTRFGNDGSTGTDYFGAQFGANGVGQSGGAAGGVGGSHTPELGGTPPGYYAFATGGGGNGGTTTGNNLGGGGGGGAGRPTQFGLAGGTPAAGGGGGGGGTDSTFGGTAGAAGAAGAGGNGGHGTGGTGGGPGGAAGAGNAGTAGTVGGGGGGSGSSTTAADPGAGGNGGSDTAYDGTHGAGGGGGGCGTCTNNSARNFVSGNGANYGGGGGGRGGARGTRASDTGGTGGGGLIVITYTPAAATPSLIFDPVAFFRPFIVR